MVLRYGIIGCGNMGREHLLNILSLPTGSRITALQDSHAPSLEAALQLIPPGIEPPKIFARHEELLHSELCDAVVIATPNFTHAELLRAALPADVHILVEKPLCTTMADCRDIVQRAQGRKKIVWVGQEYRYIPPMAEMIRMARSGYAGVLQHVSIREHREPFYPKVGNWNRFTANTGGTLVEKCCHYFNLMEFILQEEATRVFASGGQQVNHLDESYDGKRSDILDSAFVIVDFPSGARAMLDLCMYAESAVDNEEIIVVGDKGRMESLLPSLTLRSGLRCDWGQRQAWGEASSTGNGVSTRRVWDTDIRYPGYHFGASYIEHLRFAQAITQGLPAEVGLVEGMRSVALGIAAHRSIDEGRPVAMSEILGDA